jgi:Zn-dependent protease
LQEGILGLLLAAPSFVLAIVLHECAHGWVASLRGDPTAKMMGRLTLDPRPHFDPLGAIIYVVSFISSGGRFAIGWAKPVPVNPYNFREPRWDMALTSLAGPAANIAQLLAWAAILRVLVMVSPVTSGLFLSLMGRVAFYGVAINAVLMVFNLVPIPPLDGSRVLAWLLPERGAQALDRLEPIGFVILLLFLWSPLWGRVVAPAVGSVIQTALHVVGIG